MKQSEALRKPVKAMRGSHVL